MNKENKELCNTSKKKCIKSTKSHLMERNNNSLENTGYYLRKRNAGPLTDVIHVNHLPMELLSMIFGFLTPLELAKSVLPVCRHWNEIGNKPLLWRTLKFGTCGKTEDLLKVVAKSTLLRSVEIHNRNDFGLILKEIYRSCSYWGTKIEEITLKMCLLNSLSKQKKVQGSYTQLCVCCNNFNCLPITVKGGVVNVPYSTNMMDFCPNLKKLSLINMHIRSKAFFGKIGGTLRSLTALTIIGCHTFSSANLQLIATNCTKLSHITILHNVLNVEGTDIVTRNAWDQAFRDLLLKRGALLQVFEIDAEFVWDNTLEALAASTRLHTLRLEKARKLSVDGITAISTLRYLKHLHFKDCPALKVETVAQLFSPGNLGCLETLTMSWCIGITDQCLKTVASSCPRICKINVSFCFGITDEGVKFLLQGCTKLQHLNLFYTTGICGSSFQLIPQETPNLKLLIIEEYGRKVKETGMKDLIARFPGLLIRRWKPVVR